VAPLRYKSSFDLRRQIYGGVGVALARLSGSPPGYVGKKESGEMPRLKQSIVGAVTRFLRKNGVWLPNGPTNRIVAAAVNVHKGGGRERSFTKSQARQLIAEFAREIGVKSAEFHREYPSNKESSKRRVKSRFTEEYEKYIRSKEWAAFRQLIFSMRGSICEDCGTSGIVFHLHHLTYVRLGNELPEDVRILCVPCHEKIHGRKLS
jgi:hypothetical protein